jgi:hypothetical protein
MLSFHRVFLPVLAALTASACADAAPDKQASSPALPDGKADAAWLSPAAPLGLGTEGAVSGRFSRDDVFFGHDLTVRPGAQIDLEVTRTGSARALDTVMYVFGPVGDDDGWQSLPVGDDDDGGYGRLSKLSGLTLREGGVYRVVVTTWDGSGRGAYRLEARCLSGECGPITDEGGACHPAIEAAIKACAEDAAADADFDPWTTTEADLIERCADAEVIAPAWDELCAGGSGPADLCAGGLEAFASAQLPACRHTLVGEVLDAQCVFGTHYGTMFEGLTPLVIRWERKLEASDIDTLTALEAQRILEAVKATAYDDVTSLAEAFEAVDEGVVNETALWDASGRRAFVVYEVGAGDNSFGAWFGGSDVTPVALNQDGDVMGCDVGWGQEWRVCDDARPCAEGLHCNGRAGGEGPGRCLDASFDAGLSGLGASCADDLDCGEGLVCAGASLGGEGLCNPAWMRGRFAVEPRETIADGATVTTSLHVFGLATVSTDVILDLSVWHAHPSELKVTLTNPSGTEVVIADRDAAGRELYFRRVALRGFPGDESVNGTWTLSVTDAAGGQTGTLASFGLTLTSRWD